MNRTEKAASTLKSMEMFDTAGERYREHLVPVGGLTKLELYSLAAMVGILASGEKLTSTQLAERSIAIGEELGSKLEVALK